MHSTLLIAILAFGQGEGPTLRQGQPAKEGQGIYIDISIKDVRNFTVEQVYNFATGAIGDTKPLRSQVKSYIVGELERKGVELFTTDDDIERFIDLCFAFGNKFGGFWTTFTDSVPLGDGTLNSPQHKRLVAAQHEREAIERVENLLKELQQKASSESQRLDAEWKEIQRMNRELNDLKRKIGPPSRRRDVSRSLARGGADVANRLGNGPTAEVDSVAAAERAAIDSVRAAVAARRAEEARLVDQIARHARSVCEEGNPYPKCVVHKNWRIWFANEQARLNAALESIRAQNAGDIDKIEVRAARLPQKLALLRAEVQQKSDDAQKAASDREARSRALESIQVDLKDRLNSYSEKSKANEDVLASVSMYREKVAALRHRTNGSP